MASRERLRISAPWRRESRSRTTVRDRSKTSLLQQIFEVDVFCRLYSRSRRREANPTAQKDNRDPQRERRRRNGFACNRGGYVLVPLTNRPAGRQLEHKHIDSSQREQNHLRAEKEVL